MEHDRESRDITSRAFDTSDVPAASLKWVQVMNQRLAMARKEHAVVDTQAKVAQERQAALPQQARRAPPPMVPGNYWYYQVQRFNAAHGRRDEIHTTMDPTVPCAHHGGGSEASLPDFADENEYHF